MEEKKNLNTHTRDEKLFISAMRIYVRSKRPKRRGNRQSARDHLFDLCAGERDVDLPFGE